MSRKNMSRKESGKECAEFILQHEYEDFVESIETGHCEPYQHIYYSALVFLYGKADAEQTVEEIKSDLFKN